TALPLQRVGRPPRMATRGDDLGGGGSRAASAAGRNALVSTAHEIGAPAAEPARSRARQGGAGRGAGARAARVPRPGREGGPAAGSPHAGAGRKKRPYR